MHVILAIFGALSASVASAAGGTDGVILLLGVLVGLLWAEVILLRRRIDQLEQTRPSSPPFPQAVRPEAMPAPMETVLPRVPDWHGRAPERPLPSWPPLDSQQPVKRPAKPAAEAAQAGPQAVLPDEVSGGAVLGFFTSGNTVAKLGILLLFIGVAFLLRYLVEHTHISLALRLAAVAVGGALLTGLGLALTPRRRSYGLVLQAGGVGIMYLTAYSALHFYGLLSAVSTLAALVTLAVLCTVLAVVQSSQLFAVLAVALGFLAPVLSTMGEGDPVPLFSYHAVLNSSILGVAWHRSWRGLNVVGFVLTAVLAVLWGAQYYEDSLFAVTEPFLGLYFLLYLVLAVLFSFRQPPALRSYVDAVIVFGPPLVILTLQAGLLHGHPRPLAGSALGLSGVYFGLSWLLRRRLPATHRPLADSFLALAVMCLTAALPLATQGRHWATTWALEGAVLVWFGCRHARGVTRTAGWALVFASGALCGLIALGAFHPWIPLSAANDPAAMLDCVTTALAAAFSAVTLRRHAGTLKDHEARVPGQLLVWGLLWWLYGGHLAISQQVPDIYQRAAALIWVSTTAPALGEIGLRALVPLGRGLAACLLPLLYFFALDVHLGGSHPFAGGGWLAWPLAFLACYGIYARHEESYESSHERVWTNLLHCGTGWLLAAIATWESAWQIGSLTASQDAWPAPAWMLLPALLLAALPWFIRRFPWPLGRHEKTYREWVGGGIALYLVLWSIASYLSLPYLSAPGSFFPPLRGVDLGEVAVLLVLARYWRMLRGAVAAQSSSARSALDYGAAALGLLWLHATLLRSLHFWTGVDYDIGALQASTVVQTTLTIFWTSLALLLMLYSVRGQSRNLWFAGAILLGAVVVKLFVIDLAHIGTLSRVISFLGVGALMLVIGYFAPLAPPEQTQASGQESRF